jgi:hypothetical protein
MISLLFLEILVAAMLPLRYSLQNFPIPKSLPPRKLKLFPKGKILAYPSILPKPQKLL